MNFMHGSAEFDLTFNYNPVVPTQPSGTTNLNKNLISQPHRGRTLINQTIIIIIRTCTDVVDIGGGKYVTLKQNQIGDNETKNIRMQHSIRCFVKEKKNPKNRYVPPVTLLIYPSSFWRLRLGLPGDTIPILANMITQLEFRVLLVP